MDFRSYLNVNVVEVMVGASHLETLEVVVMGGALNCDFGRDVAFRYARV